MYRYGLNDPLQQVRNVSSSNVRSTDIVYVFLNRYHSRRRSHGRQRNSGLSSDITMDQLRNLYEGHVGQHLLMTLQSIQLQHLLTTNASSFLKASINVLEVFF